MTECPSATRKRCLSLLSDAVTDVVSCDDYTLADITEVRTQALRLLRLANDATFPKGIEHANV